MSTPAVSVIISAYNAQRYLAEAMQSVLTQTFGDFECIVVDDGSTDATKSMLARIAAKDSRVRVISRANKGLTVSLNEALAAARAPLIARMDADDVTMPDRFSKQVAFMNAHAEIICISSTVELVDPFGVHIGVLTPPADHAAIDASLMQGNGGAIVHPAAMMRTEIVRQIGGYQEKYNNSEDLDLWLRLAEVGRLANVPETLLKYRRDLGSVSHTKRDNQLRMKSQILGDAYARRGLTPPSEWKFDAWMPKPHDIQLKEWGWKALSLGRRDAAMGHARSLVKLHPFSGRWMAVDVLRMERPMTFSTPPISVIMSVYNGEEYLAEAMDSILNQTFADFEFIIIDDGSKDRSKEIVLDYAKRDSRIVFEARENAGLPAALNYAARLAKGEYLARMDPDDVALPERFEKQHAFMQEHPEVACVGSRVILIDPFGVPYNLTDHPLTHEEIDRDMLKGIGWAIVHPAAFMRKSMLEKAGWYNEAYRTSQDFELWLRMAEVGRLANIPDHVLKYRQHLGSANFAKAEQQKKFKTQVLTTAYARRGLPAFDPSILAAPPTTDPFEIRKRWGWAAIREKRFDAARKHAYANLKSKPMNVGMWKLLYCSVRG